MNAQNLPLNSGDPIPEDWVDLAKDWRYSDEFVGSIIRHALGGPDYEYDKRPSGEPAE